jgi:ABC-type oligopeptide transport system substrate-binding subunit
MKRCCLAVVALLLALWGNAAHAQDQRRILRVVPSADPAVLDPTRGLNLIARIFAQAVFETLFALDSPPRAAADDGGAGADQPRRPDLHIHATTWIDVS